jgi:hypothetical protein
MPISAQRGRVVAKHPDVLDDYDGLRGNGPAARP